MLWSRFALRYMFSPKSHSVINIIAWVSLVAVAVPTAAMIILLAMFEGLTGVIEELDTAMDADIEIVARRGQTFASDALRYDELRNIEGVAEATPYIEQSVMSASAGRRIPMTLRGITPSYFDVTTTADYLVRGDINSIFAGDILLGASLASSLAAYGTGTEIELYALNRKQLSTLLPTSGISRTTTHLGAVVSGNIEIDETVALMELERVQQLLNHKERISAIALRIEEGADISSVEQAIEGHVGEEFNVVTRQEKNASIYAILRMEKFAILLIGALIALVAAFAIVGSVIMLITEKQHDIATLRAIGARQRLINAIFTGEGVMLTATGCLLGVLLGIFIAVIQSVYGIVKIPGGGFLESYPVELNAGDVVTVIAVVMTIGCAVSWFTVRAKLRNLNKLNG